MRIVLGPGCATAGGVASRAASQRPVVGLLLTPDRESPGAGNMVRIRASSPHRTELLSAPEPNRASVLGMTAFPDRIAGLDARFVGRAPDRATICGVDARNRRPDAVFGDEVPFDVARWERHQVARAESADRRS